MSYIGTDPNRHVDQVVCGFGYHQSRRREKGRVAFLLEQRVSVHVSGVQVCGLDF